VSIHLSLGTYELSLCGHLCTHFCVDVVTCLWMELLGLLATWFNFWRNCQTVFQELHHFTCPTCPVGPGSHLFFFLTLICSSRCSVTALSHNYITSLPAFPLKIQV
jgi:hypothetical protein